MDLTDIVETLSYVGISYNLSIEYEIKGKGYITDKLFKIRKKIEELEDKNMIFKLESFLKEIGKPIRFYKIKKWLLLRKVK